MTQLQVDGHRHYLTFKTHTCKPRGIFAPLTTNAILTAHGTKQLKNEPCGEDNKKKFSALMDEKRNYSDHFGAGLLNTPLQVVVYYWRDRVRINLQSTFKQEIDQMIKRAIFPETLLDGKTFSIAVFKRIRHREMIGLINEQSDWSEEMKEQITDCYREFIEWLSKESPNDFDPYLLGLELLSSCCISAKSSNAMSSIVKISCSHTSLRNHVVHPDHYAFSFSDWRNFLEALGKQNKRDELITRTLLQGKKRVSQAINLTTDQIDFTNNSIRYTSKKKTDEVRYETSFMQELRVYIDSTTAIRKNSSYVFITRTGRPLTRRHLNYSLSHICDQHDIKRITPDSLRNLWNIFKQEKYTDKAIMQSKEARIEESKKEWQKKMEEMLNPEISK